MFVKGISTEELPWRDVQQITSHIGLGMCEGVGEDSRHGFGNVDIRIGS